MKVYSAISNVARDLAATGIKKEGKNAQQGFKFRGLIKFIPR
ncbi:hypothetical protein SODG_004735 [Sodalis praecaptivus]